MTIQLNKKSDAYANEKEVECHMKVPPVSHVIALRFFSDKNMSDTLFRTVLIDSSEIVETNTFFF